MKNMRIALATLLLTMQLQAQDPSVFGETVEVRITNVEAIVTDKSGKPVHGLTKDDFEVYEDGVKQEITNFAEISESIPAATLGSSADAPAATPAPRDIRRRLVSVFLDNASLEPGNRNALLPVLRQFLAANVRPGDGVSIYAWNLGLTVELEPTSEPAAIEKALANLSQRPVAFSNNWKRDYIRELETVISMWKSRGERLPLRDAVGTAASYAMRGSAAMRQKTEALKSVISSLRGVDGRKVLVVLTQSLSDNPAEEAFHYITLRRADIAGAETFNPHSEARGYQLTGMTQDITGLANGAGVTLYPIQAAGKFTDSTFADASQSSEGGMILPATVDSSTPNMHAIADLTGGKALTGSSNFKLAFDTITTDLNVYYSLGYRASGERRDRVKNVDVRLRNKRYNLRTRKAIVEQTATTEMNDMVAANLFHTRGTNDLSITAKLGGEPTPAGENVIHPVIVTIPTSTLTLVPDGDDLVGKFSLFAAFLRADGAVSKVGRQSQQFRFPAASLSKRKEVTVKLDVTSDPRTDSISLGVMDEVSSATGFASIKIPQTK